MQPTRRLTPALVAAALCLSSFAPLPSRTVASAAAASCPVEPPSPLRVLYLRSERVVVAKVGESARVEGEDTENQRKTSFEVTESLKGDGGERALHVYHYVWNDSPDWPTNFRRGDTLLLFLSPGTDDSQDGYYVTDARYGAKKLSEDDLKVYLKRIEELQWVMRTGKPDPGELAEWLVRCAEEPATRWEGAYELAVSASLAAQSEEAKEGLEPEDSAEGPAEGEDEEDLDAELGVESQEAEEASAEASGESEADAQAEEAGVAEEEATVEAEAESQDVENLEVSQSTEEILDLPLGFVGTNVGASLINHLTEQQKERLASALLGAEKIGEGEMELVEVVSAWGGARLAPFLVKHLQKLADDPPYEAERLVHALGVALKDRKIARLAQKYSENAPYYDESPEGEGEATEDGANAPREATPAGGPARPTHTRRRSEMLKRFIVIVEKRIGAGDETAQT